MEYTLQLVIVATLAVSVLVFFRLARRVREGSLSRAKGLLLYLGAVLAPAGLFVAFGLLLVGLEEWSGSSLVPELFARGFLMTLALCLAIAILGFIFFAVRLALMEDLLKSP